MSTLQAINFNDTTIDINSFLELMARAHKYQSYLNDANFKKYKEFENLIYNLKLNDYTSLNPIQQKVLKFYDEKIITTEAIQTFSPQIDDNDGGVSYKYTNPNGYISALLIIGCTIFAGVMIAAILLV